MKCMISFFSVWSIEVILSNLEHYMYISHERFISCSQSLRVRCILQIVNFRNSPRMLTERLKCEYSVLKFSTNFLAHNWNEINVTAAL